MKLTPAQLEGDEDLTREQEAWLASHTLPTADEDLAEPTDEDLADEDEDEDEDEDLADSFSYEDLADSLADYGSGADPLAFYGDED